MDIYKLGFVILQIIALAWLMCKVQARYKFLTQRFITNVKARLVQLNLQQVMEDPAHEFQLTFENSELDDLDLKKVLNELPLSSSSQSASSPLTLADIGSAKAKIVEQIKEETKKLTNLVGQAANQKSTMISSASQTQQQQFSKVSDHETGATSQAADRGTQLHLPTYSSTKVQKQQEKNEKSTASQGSLSNSIS